jgi:hypothetical protein
MVQTKAITDQPGRLIAIFLLAPYLINAGKQYKDNKLSAIGYVFLIYEILWLLNADPRTISRT